MTITFSDRIKKIKPSATLAITAKAAELKEAGHKIIGLGAGEPDFDTPDHIKLAAINAIELGFTKYTAVGGIKSLKEAIQNRFKQDNQLDYSLDEIMVSSGAKQAIYNAMQCLLQEGDEVIIPAPYWVSYPEMTLLTGAKPVIIQADIKNNFKVSVSQLKKAINDNTKMIILNSPSNPTGIAYSKKELKHIAKVIMQHPNIMVLSDDIYEHILWNHTPYHNIVMAEPDIKHQTVIINGVSKAYSMTGWRIGYAAGPADLIKAMTKLQGQCSSNPCSISQKAAEAALTGTKYCILDMVKEFKKRHDYIVGRLNSLPGFECLPGDGAFYAFPCVEKLIQSINDVESDIDLAEKIINEAEVAVVPGTAFGAPGYIRISFATSMELLEEALDRLEQFASNYIKLEE